MSPQRDTYIFSENNPEIDFEYIPRNGNTNAQLIIRKNTDTERYGYNFNAEEKNKPIGHIGKGMATLFNIPENRWYNRHISNDYSMLQITEMTDNEKTNYLDELKVKNTPTTTNG